jgi:Na+-translocating ferredoxin:NAD+ oxidoreductase RnfC subunit
LITTLGLKKYDVEAPIVDVEITSKNFKVMLSQHIGAPATASVVVGGRVKAGDVIGNFDAEKLGVAIHAPADALVTEVTGAYVLLRV